MSLHIGAHQSTAGGYSKALERVHDIGGNCLQIFSTSPRGWKPADPSDAELERFTTLRDEYKIDPVYFHASYLINLAGSEETQIKSVDSLTAELETAHTFGIRGSVIHLGSFKDKEKAESFSAYSLDDGYKTLLNNIRTVLKNTPEDTLFIIENMGTRKIGKSMEEIGFVADHLNNSRVRVCLDTCHLHAAGYDLSTKDSYDSFFEEFDKHVGFDLLEVIHLNDSRDEFGSLRDRHENIGEGHVGEAVFKNLLNDKQLSNTPFILETPGFDGNGPDAKNVEKVKGLANDKE